MVFIQKVLFVIFLISFTVQASNPKELLTEVRYLDSGAVEKGIIQVKALPSSLPFRALRTCSLALGLAAIGGGVVTTAILSPGEIRNVSMWIGMGGVVAAMGGAGLFALEPRKKFELIVGDSILPVFKTGKYDSIQVRILERLIQEAEKGQEYAIFGKGTIFDASINKIIVSVERAQNGAILLKELIAYVKRPDSLSRFWREPLVPVKFDIKFLDAYTVLHGHVVE